MPPHERACGGARAVRYHSSNMNGDPASMRPALDPERLAARLERAGCEGPENLLVALAVLTTTASPLRDVDVEWIASTASRIADTDLLLEAAGVVFAFNTVNRIADARQVELEFRFLRELTPIRGFIQRRLASLAGLVYDLSFQHEPRHSPAALMERLRVVFARLGIAAAPDVFHWLSRSPVVLEGVLEMIESNVTTAGVHLDLLREAIAIGVASRAMPGSDLSRAVDPWLPRESSRDLNAHRASTAPSDNGSDSALVSACRRYAWQVANAPYTITEEQIGELESLGLSDAELLDLTVATAVFAALAIIEPISRAVTSASIDAEKTLHPTNDRQVRVQLV